MVKVKIGRERYNLGNTFKMDTFIVSTLTDILNNGVESHGARPVYESDRERAESKYITDVYIKFDLSKGELPLSSLRRTPFVSAVKELDWMYTHQTSDLGVLNDLGVHYWNQWATENNDIGLRYGATVKKHDIINKLLKGLEDNPYNRRNIINLWQYEDLATPAPLPPCCFEVIFDVRNVNDVMFLDASITQR